MNLYPERLNGLLSDNKLPKDSWILAKNVRTSMKNDQPVEAYVFTNQVSKIELRLGSLTEDEKEILEDGCLINYYRHS